MKKINVLYTIWATSYGGAERFVLNLIKNLDKSKYNIVVFSDSMNAGPLQDEFISAGAKIYRAKYHRFKHPIKFKKQIRSIIEKERIDIVHANDDLNMIFPLLAKNKKATFIAHSHNTKFRFTRNGLISMIMAKIIMKIISDKSDIRLSCGEEAGKALFGNKNFRVIFNGIDAKKFRFSEKKRMELRRELGLTQDHIVILNIGRMDKQKNQSFLVDVFDKCRKINRNAKLVIIGDGAERDSLKKQITEKKLSKDIFLLSNKKDVSDYYCVADIFVMTSLFEGMPVAAIEAQASDLPCVFSDVITQEVDYTGNVCFVALDSDSEQWARRIMGLVNDRTKRDHIDVEGFDIKNVANKVDDVYSSIGNLECLENNNKVSIIIPAYNAERYIGRCLSSIACQTYKNIEVIIVDDDSSDGTVDVARKMAKNDSRIRIFKKKNEGPGRARMFGVKKATGKYVMFVDSDDFIEKSAVTTIVGNFLLSGADIIRFHASYYPNGKILEEIKVHDGYRALSHDEAVEMLTSTDKLSSMCFQAYKIECFDGVDLPGNIVYCEDYLMNQAVYRKQYSVVVVDNILYHYRINEKSTTRTTSNNRLKKNIAERIFACLETIDLIESSSLVKRKKQIAKGFQIERLRRDFVKMPTSAESIQYILTSLESQNCKSLFEHISPECIDKYTRGLKIGKRLFRKKILLDIYMKNEPNIAKYMNRYSLYNKIKDVIK